MSRTNIISARKAKALKPRFIDARWYLPNDTRDAKEEFLESHLPGAVFFPIDDIATQNLGHPHLAPSPEALATWLGQAGIGPKDRIVIYDDTGFFSAPRVWFLLKALGHGEVYVLEGGIKGWREAGGDVTDEKPSFASAVYPVPDDLAWPIVDRLVVLDGLSSRIATVVDARPAGRFKGRDPEPRPGLPSGHMPGSINIPYTSLVGEEGGFLPADELALYFKEKGLHPSRPVITSCGSGISACVLILGLAEAGWPQVVLYDGSWIDWASRPDAEIETGS